MVISDYRTDGSVSKIVGRSAFGGICTAERASDEVGQSVVSVTRMKQLGESKPSNSDMWSIDALTARLP